MTVALRYVAESVVEPATKAGPTLQLESVAGGSARLNGDLPDLPPDGQNLFAPGDVLFSKLRPYLAKSFLVRQPMQGTGEFLCLRPSDRLDSRFLKYVTLSHPWLEHAGMSSYGSKMPRTSWQHMSDYRLPELEIGEQRRIADFLDDRVSRIDRIVAARREQSALISAHETADLQELFDSCARRFGEIRLGHALNGLEQGWSPQAEARPAGLGEWGVMRSGCVNGGEFHAKDNKALPDGLDPAMTYEIQGGDLLMSRASGSLDLIGSVAVVPLDVRERLLLCDKIYRLTPGPDWSANFLAPMLRSRGNRDRVRLGVSGAEGMANNLPSGVIRGLRVPAATRNGQITVIEQAEALAKESGLMRAKLARSIDLLTEYKSSLITAAVTGELDVTTAGSNIPG